jgi:hypothetical protein
MVLPEQANQTSGLQKKMELFKNVMKMKNKKSKLIMLILIGIVLIVVLYRLLFCYSLLRISTRATTENIVGEKYTTVNVLNPFRTNNIKKVLHRTLNELSDDYPKSSFLRQNIEFQGEIRILDIYSKNDELLVFTECEAINDTSISKVLFICDVNDYKVQDIQY